MASEQHRQVLLVVALNTAPELTGIGKYTGELAEDMARRGWQVRVVAAPPYYPAWRVSPPWSAWRYRCERQGDVAVMRCPLYVPRRPEGLRRVLHLASFALSSLPVLLWQCLIWRPRWVLVIEPPLLVAPGALLAAGLCGARTWLHVQDFEVDAAFSLGLLRGQRARALALTAERWLMRRFGRVSSISLPMLERLRAKGVSPPRIAHFPNWADTDAIRPYPDVSPLRREWGVPDGTLVLLYAGNLGAKQGLEILVEAARALATDRRLLFVVCGEGSARAGLVREAAGLDNLMFLPLQPLHRLNDLLASADIHLLPQRAGVADLVMPSKLTGMLASGRPVIATAAAQTAVGAVVAIVGRVVPPGDLPALCTAIRALADDPALRRALGAAGRGYAVEHWSRQGVIDGFERALLAD